MAHMGEISKELFETTSSVYRGYHLPAIVLEKNLRSNLGMGKMAYQLAMDSVTTTTWLGFYMVGEDIDFYESSVKQFPEELEYLPENVKVVGRLIFSDCQRRVRGESGYAGVWFKDILDFTVPTPPESVIPRGFVYAVLYKSIEGWEVADEEKKLFVPQGGIKYPVEIPASNGAFAVPSGESSYNTITGIPGKVEPNRDKAIRAWVNEGFTEKQAMNKVSRVYTKNSGIAIIRSYAFREIGPLCLDLGGRPWATYGNFGSVSAHRLKGPDRTY